MDIYGLFLYKTIPAVFEFDATIGNSLIEEFPFHKYVILIWNWELLKMENIIQI